MGNSMWKWAVVCAVLCVAACGGGDSNGTNPPVSDEDDGGQMDVVEEPDTQEPPPDGSDLVDADDPTDDAETPDTNDPPEEDVQEPPEDVDDPPEDTDVPDADEPDVDEPDADEPPVPVELTDLVAYVDTQARFNRAVRLSDGTFVVTGQVGDMAWVPEQTPVDEIGAGEINSAAEGGALAVMIHMSADLQEIKRVVHMPAGTALDVTRVRTTEIPGQPTGDMYISGQRQVGDVQQDGYYIARLDNNFVDGPPTALVWAYNVRAKPRRAGGFQGTSAFKSIQPWDVGADGKVVYGLGAEYDFDWAAIERLTADGQRDVVEHWPAHWLEVGGEYYDPASTYDGEGSVSHSGIVLKAGRRGSLRSRTQADFDLLQDDGNGGVERKGRFPDDYYFTEPCTADSCPGRGPGYTGYSTSDKPTQRLGGVVIDRRTNHIYLGYSTQSRFGNGTPDFEPAVVAMTDQGELKWWSRLYTETNDNSPPDQYIDALAIDYASDALTVLARCHGNNTINYWSGDAVVSNPDARGFQNRFSGSSGNIHIQWLGKLGLDSGQLARSTFVAEFAENTGRMGFFDDEHPRYAGNPNPNAQWPDLNTTRCRTELDVAPDGRVLLTCTGRRTTTTTNAYQRLVDIRQGVGAWNDFVRVYTPELGQLDYSSVLMGPYDEDTGMGGGNNVQLQHAIFTPGGLLVVGYHKTEDGQVRGQPVPTTEGLPLWGASVPGGESPLVGHLEIRPFE